MILACLIVRSFLAAGMRWERRQWSDHHELES